MSKMRVQKNELLMSAGSYDAETTYPVASIFGFCAAIAQPIG